MEESMYEEGYGDDNVLNKLAPEDREEKLRTQPVYSEEEKHEETINVSLTRKELIGLLDGLASSNIEFQSSNSKEGLNGPAGKNFYNFLQGKFKLEAAYKKANMNPDEELYDGPLN